MENNDSVIKPSTFFENCCGFKLEAMDKSDIDNANSLLVPIENSILEALNESFDGNSALKASINPNDYMSYCDGTKSTMIASKIGKGNVIKSHKGLEIIKLSDVANNIVRTIQKNIGNTIVKALNTEVLRLFKSYKDGISYIKDLILLEHFTKIDAWKFFYNDLEDDAAGIFSNIDRRRAYLNKIVSLKTDIMNEFLFFEFLLKDSNCNACELGNIMQACAILVALYKANSVYEYLFACDYSKDINTIITRNNAFVHELENLFSSFQDGKYRHTLTCFLYLAKCVFDMDTYHDEELLKKDEFAKKNLETLNGIKTSCDSKKISLALQHNLTNIYLVGKK